MLSPFVQELPTGVYVEEREGYGGALYAAPGRPGSRNEPRPGRPERESGGALPGRSGPVFETPEAAFISAPAPAGAGAGGHFEPEQRPAQEKSLISGLPKDGSLGLGYCRHRLFGRGKIVQHIPPDKYRVNFTGFGLKVIMAEYLALEDE